MDEPPIIDDPDAEEPQAPAEVEEAPPPKAPAPAEVVFEGRATGKEPWRGGSGCSNRLPLYGCLIGLVLLIGTLFAGTSMMRRTVWVNMERGRRAVVQQLPRDLPAEEIQRTVRNLDRFRAVLEASKDPYPEMGEFMNKVRFALNDGRLNADEVETLNLYLEQVIEASGIQLMQLGRLIRPVQHYGAIGLGAWDLGLDLWGLGPGAWGLGMDNVIAREPNLKPQATSRKPKSQASSLKPQFA